MKEITCMMCDGNKVHTVPVYDKDGKLIFMTIDCPACRGTGKIYLPDNKWEEQ